jgi:hypothetical protein
MVQYVMFPGTSSGQTRVRRLNRSNSLAGQVNTCQRIAREDSLPNVGYMT